MRKEVYRNHINITFNVIGKGNSLIESINSIYEIAKRNKAQSNLFENRSSWKHDTNGDIVGETIGNIGGTITFHNHSCDIVAATNELTAALQSFGINEGEVYDYNETTRELIKR